MQTMRSLPEALATGPVVLDGGLSTELEARGHDVSSALWSARLLRDDPAAIVAAHAAFAAAGAQVATTASYQATVEGFQAAGISPRQAARLIERSVILAREGQENGWVAGSVGPYGAMLADGSEYTGAYVEELDIRALRAFHRPRMDRLTGAGADVLACETGPAAAAGGGGRAVRRDGAGGGRGGCAGRRGSPPRDAHLALPDDGARRGGRPPHAA